MQSQFFNKGFFCGDSLELDILILSSYMKTSKTLSGRGVQNPSRAMRGFYPYQILKYKDSIPA